MNNDLDTIYKFKSNKKTYEYAYINPILLHGEENSKNPNFILESFYREIGKEWKRLPIQIVREDQMKGKVNIIIEDLIKK